MESSHFKMLRANSIFVFCYLLVSFDVKQTKEYMPVGHRYLLGCDFGVSVLE